MPRLRVNPVPTPAPLGNLTGEALFIAIVAFLMPFSTLTLSIAMVPS